MLNQPLVAVASLSALLTVSSILIPANIYRLWPSESQSSYGVAISPDGVHLAAAGGYNVHGDMGPGEIWVWNSRTGTLAQKFHVLSNKHPVPRLFA